MKIFIFAITLFVSGISFGEVGTITRISFENKIDRYHVFVLGEGKLECNTVLMDHPPRIALDFPDVRNKLYPSNYEAEENAYVSRIRTSQFTKGPGSISRVVVDLKSAADYSLRQVKGGVVLQLFRNNQTVSTSSPVVEQKIAQKPKTPEPTTRKPAAESTTPIPTQNTTPAAQNTTPTTTQKTAPDSKTNATSPSQTTSPGVQPQKPPEITPGSATNPDPKRTASPPAVHNSAELVIGSEDLLEIAVFELPQFNTTGRVQGDGTISIPLVGGVMVSGLTKREAEQKIAEALQSQYVNNASVGVTIKEYRSRQVSFLGAVKSPGAYYITSPRTLLQMITEAGGLQPEAGNKCFVFRSGSSKIEVDLYELVNEGNPKLNILIYPGDIVNIPGAQKVIIYVFGAVRTPGTVEMSSAMPLTLVAAIANAGGPAENANQSKIQIKRKAPDGKETIIKANLKDILKGKADDVLLQPGDVINVPESFF